VELVDLFPRTIAVSQLQSLTPEVIRQAVELLDQAAMTGLGPDGGYTEEQQLLDHPLFREVREEILGLVRQLSDAYCHEVDAVRICNSWGNVVGFEQSIRYHRHDNSYISGSFYLTKGSRFQLLNNFHNDMFGIVPNVRPDANSFRALGALDIDPEPGRVILFPSGMYHCVVPSTSREKRYSVAFNTVPVGQVGKPTSFIDL